MLTDISPQLKVEIEDRRKAPENPYNVCYCCGHEQLPEDEPLKDTLLNDKLLKDKLLKEKLLKYKLLNDKLMKGKLLNDRLLKDKLI